MCGPLAKREVKIKFIVFNQIYVVGTEVDVFVDSFVFPFSQAKYAVVFPMVGCQIQKISSRWRGSFCIASTYFSEGRTDLTREAIGP